MLCTTSCAAAKAAPAGHRGHVSARPGHAARPAAALRRAVTTQAAVVEKEAAPAGDAVAHWNYSIEAEKSPQWKDTMNVVVTGAAGQIANHLLFMLASGEVFGKDQPISLSLLGSDRSREALEGVAMELEDSLYPLLRDIRMGVDPYRVFEGADWALLIGAKPRGPGMQRRDLLDINGQVFQEQGRALNAVAKRDCKMLVVGNPCNTNALIGMENAPDLDRRNWHALTRLDENRAKGLLARKAGVFYTSVPDFVNAKVIRDPTWLKEEFTPVVANRGGALIAKWGRSSAASTAVSIADHLCSLYTPTPPGDCFSSAVVTDGNPEKLAATEDELKKERDCVGHLIPNAQAAVCLISEDTMLPGES
eukprot:scaffold20.g7820.t1